MSIYSPKDKKYVCGMDLNAKGIRPRYNKHEWFNRKTMKWTEYVYFCPNCLEDCYWDSDNGQMFFDYCPFCGEKMTKEM